MSSKQMGEIFYTENHIECSLTEVTTSAILLNGSWKLVLPLHFGIEPYLFMITFTIFKTRNDL